MLNVIFNEYVVDTAYDYLKENDDNLIVKRKKRSNTGIKLLQK